MRWSDIRAAHPQQWLVVEALEARSSGGRRIVERLAVLDVCADGAAAFARYRELHRRYPQRELFFVHTANEELDIEEREWVGVRRGDAPGAAR